MEKIFAKDTADKGLLSKIYKELLKLNMKTKTWLKVSQDLSRYLIKDMQMANMHIKNVPQAISSGKCKLIGGEILVQDGDTGAF